MSHVEIIDGRAVGITARGKPCQKCVRLGVLCGHHRTIGRPTPKRHEGQCKACQHPEIERIERLWVDGNLTDSAAANLLGCATRSWKRHCTFAGLYILRAKAKRMMLGKIAQRGIAEAKHVTVADALRAIDLDEKIEHGGERVKVSVTDFIDMARQLREAVKAGKLPADVID